ncbi:MAG: hypothetical protein AABZ06_00910 [Bdellovibrionota bacterium]
MKEALQKWCTDFEEACRSLKTAGNNGNDVNNFKKRSENQQLVQTGLFPNSENDGRIRCKGSRGQLTPLVCKIISENRDGLIHHLKIDIQFSFEFNESLQELCRYYNEKIKHSDGNMMDFIATKNSKLYQEINILDDELNQIWLEARLQNATIQEFMESLEQWETLHKIAINFYSSEFKPHAVFFE